MSSATPDLDPPRWARVELLFADAVELPPAERRAFLDQHCGDDEELKAYLLELLQADSADDATIEQTIVESMSRAFGETGDEDLAGQRIGPYRIERLLGSGGMGMVYLASRDDDQFEQRVAIKLGRHRLVDPQTMLRLRNERQILADLDHPNIAKLFDGGTTPDGVPYLVMEYIDGLRIDQYCDRHNLTLEDRLRLVQTVCAAVHYAHQNLVVHRDIKASNILVTDDGTPKLLDFGIAKLIDTQGAAAAGLTREGAVVMTPENAAPEQIQGKGATTATDTYALGLLLYSLLSGLRPWTFEALTPHEFATLVCTTPAPRPSARVHEEHLAAKTDPGVSQLVDDLGRNRSTTAERLQRALRGDLDTIVLKAIRKEPERRYRSVSALADDIERYLTSLPIQARADSWRYRAGKFVRRHYAAVAAGIAAFVLLAGFSVALSVQNQRITAERDTAQQVSAFLENIFRAPDPAQARGASITAREILETGARQIQTELGDSPAIRATLMGTIGRVYFNLGEYQPSVELLEEALATRLATDGPDHLSVAAARNDLAATLIQQAEYGRAQELLLQALATHRRNADGPSAALASNLLNLAEVQLKIGKLDDAEQYAIESAAIYSTLGDSHIVELAESKSTLARILQIRGELAATESLLEETISLLVEHEGRDHPHLAVYLQNLGVLQRSQGRLDAASATFAEAIEVSRRVLGGHDLLAVTLRDRGTVLHAQGDFEQAEALMREALAIDVASRGTDHPRVGYDLTILGMLLHDKPDLGAAENMLARAVRIFEGAFDGDHQYTASALTELGAVLNSSNRAAEALPLLERALAIRVQGYPPGHELLAATRTEYADTLTRLGRLDEAEVILSESLRDLTERSGRRRERAEQALARLQSARDRN